MSFEDIDLQWFAAEDEGRTEEASQVKIDKARKEGRVAKSQEVNGALVMIFTVLTVVLLAPWLLDQFIQVFVYFFSRCASEDFFNASNAAAFYNFYLKMVIPVAVIAAIAGIAGNLIQNRGFLFSTKPITPNFSKILPHFGEYFKKTIFSLQGAFNIVKSILKVAIIVVVAFNMIRRNLPDLLYIIHENGSIAQAMGKISWIAAQLLFFAAGFFLIIAIPDYFVSRHEFLESLKMTKQEVKEEYKEMEGNPEVKGRIRQAQQQLLQSNIPRAVRESDVVLTNPTHFAVALKYDASVENSAPQVNAKGQDFLAQKIKEYARDADVPIVENRPLARELYAQVEVGDIIPDAYITAIAQVYAQLKKFSNNT